MNSAKSRTLVYSCSGCSSAAQLANAAALRLDREGLAEMSCIAGVGGGIKPLVNTARSGRPILILDGCPLRCSAACLRNAGVVADAAVTLSDFGVKKRQHVGFDEMDLQRVYGSIRRDHGPLLNRAASESEE